MHHLFVTQGANGRKLHAGRRARAISEAGYSFQVGHGNIRSMGVDSIEAGREKGSTRLDGFLHKSGAYAFFSQLRMHPEKVREIPFEQFRLFLTRINGIAREIPVRQRGVDGNRVYVEGFVSDHQVPRSEDKEMLLREAYETIGNLRYAGDERFMLPAVVNAVHLYADGNGRTSRVLHLLLTAYDSESKLREDVRKTLSDDGRYVTHNVDPSLIDASIERVVLEQHGISYDSDTVGRAVPPDGFTRLFGVDAPESMKGKEFAQLRQRDNWYAFLGAYIYLKEHNLLDEVTFSSGDARGLSMQKMDTLLGDQGWQGVIDNYYRLKREHVEALINIFVEPEKYKSISGASDIRDEFLREIENSHQYFKIE